MIWELAPNADQLIRDRGRLASGALIPPGGLAEDPWMWSDPQIHEVVAVASPRQVLWGLRGSDVASPKVGPRGDGWLGFAVVQPISEVFEILYFEIFAPHRGQGLGKLALRGLTLQLFKGAGHGGPQKLWLEVHEDNARALKLYLDFGFRQTGVRPRYYRDGKAAILLNYEGLP